jgi:AcrR family transcriptional regulator
VKPDRPLPPAPSITRRKVPPSTRTLSRATIIDVALTIVDEEGLEAVTMRRVAEELNTGPASLYAHVANKQELQDELLDRVIGEIDPIVPDPANWREQTKDYMRAMHDVLVAHKDVAAVALGKIPLGPNALDSMENLLALLRAGGLDDRTCALAADLLPQYVVAGVYEYAVGWSEMKSLDVAEAYTTQVRDYFETLPPDRFPNLVDLAAEVTSFNPDYNERFEFGLEVLIAGLEAHHDVRPPKGKKK